jgi:hypothetical protein
MSETKAVVASDQELIDKSVKFINETVVETMYKGSLEIGEYLLKYFYNDDIKLASSKDPHKPVSYQALCKRPDLGVHPSTLSRMVWVASQEKYFVQNNVNAESLSYSHKIEFTKLDNDKKKLELVEKCINEKMSCRKLAEDILAIRQKTSSKIEPSPLRLISNIDKLIEGTQIPTLLSKPEKLERMRPKTRTEIRERTSSLIEKMNSIAKECNALIKTLDQIEKKKLVEKEKKEIEKEERKAKKEKAKEEKEKKKAEEERKVKEEKKEEVAEKSEKD